MHSHAHLQLDSELYALRHCLHCSEVRQAHTGLLHLENELAKWR